MPPRESASRKAKTRSLISGDRITLGCIIVTIATIVSGVTFVLRTVERMLEAENRLHATIIAMRAAEQYLDLPDDPGWPESWDDLERVSVDYGWTHWPDDRAFLEDRVSIDFDATLEDVASQQNPAWTAIVPNGDAFDGWRDSVVAVRDAASRAIERRRSP